MQPSKKIISTEDSEEGRTNSALLSPTPEQFSIAIIQAGRLYRRPYVRDVKPGFAIKGGEQTTNPCISVSVDKKLCKEDLFKNRRKALPKFINGVTLDIVEQNFPIRSTFSQNIKKLSANQHLFQPGDLIQTEKYGDASVCFLVKNQKKIYFLTAYHALMDIGAPVHTRTSTGAVAEATDLYNFEFDVGLAECIGSAGRNFLSTVGLPVKMPRKEIHGEPLRFIGGLTKTAYGVVASQGEIPDTVSFSTLYDKDNVFIVRFSEGHITHPGDSGGLWFDESTGEPIGLHMQLVSVNERHYSAACRLRALFDRKDILPI